MSMIDQIDDIETGDDIVNATMTELVIMLLFTVGLSALFYGDITPSPIAGTKFSCMFEYKSNGDEDIEERAFLRIEIEPTRIITSHNGGHPKHYERAKLLLGDNYNEAIKTTSYDHEEVEKLIQTLNAYNIQTNRNNNAIKRPCRFYALYIIHMYIPDREEISAEHSRKIVRTKDILNKLTYAALPANTHIVNGILRTIDAQIEPKKLESYLVVLRGQKKGKIHLKIKGE